MAQRKQLSWSDLRLGIFVIVGILVIAGGIFYVTGGSAFTSRYRLLTYLPEVDGLDQGAPVTLDGIQIGNVRSVSVARLAPGQAPNPDRAVQVEMLINRSFQDDIRSDSVASLLTEGFLGNRVVQIERGYTGRVLQDGEAVQGTEEKAMRQIVERSADLMQNLSGLSTQIEQIVKQIQTGHGTLGKLVEDESAYNHLNNTLGKVEQIADSVQQGQGTLGKLVESDSLYTKADSMVGHLNDVTGAIAGQKGTLGKMIYDPTLHDDATQFLANTNNVLADIRAGRGTLGKLATDDSLFQSARQAAENVRDATAKLNESSSTAGKFFSDPQLYDNLTGLTGDMRLLLGDFRANPKKFLRIKLSLF